jgi:hypothetical protein
MFARCVATLAAVLVLAAGAQAQSKSVKTVPQTKPFVPVYKQPIYKVPVYKPFPVYTPPAFYPPVFFKPFPVYQSPYQSPFGSKFPWYGW